MPKRGPRAITLYENKMIFSDGAIMEARIVIVPEAVQGSAHHLKYSLFYGRPGQRLVAYDNERPKGDHKHIGDREERYRFTTIEQLVSDFLDDVERNRGEPVTLPKRGGEGE